MRQFGRGVKWEAGRWTRGLSIFHYAVQCVAMRGMGERIRRWLRGGSSRREICRHKDQIRDVEPGSEGCEACLELGDKWVHLRMCMSCGQVGCCDQSKNRHATAHFKESGHPIIRSLEPGEGWLWCYVDETLLPTDKPPGEELPGGIGMMGEL